MKTNWQTKKLGDLILNNPKSTIKVRDALSLGKYIFFTSGDRTFFFDDFLCKGENIFIATGGKAMVKFFDGEASYSTDTFSIKANPDLTITKFLFYFILLNLDYIGKKLFLGAAIKHLQKKDFRNLKIQIPSIREQKRIVKILDKVLDKTTRAKKNAEKNLQNSKELFESYLQGIFENPGEDWEDKKIGEFLKLEYGKPLDEKDRNPTGKFPVYGANGEKDRTNKFYYDKPTIIVGRKGSAGELNLTENKFWPLDVTYFVVFNKKKYNLKFIYFLLRTLEIAKLAKGVKPGINRNDVYSINVFIPGLKEQKRIVKKLDKLSEETKKLEEIYKQKLVDLDELKKSVLKLAFNGKL